MRAIGKLTQFAGLAFLPIGVVMELTGALPGERPVAGLLIMMVFGFCLFYAGRYVEGFGGQ
ncbi:MAG: hypothetical protein QGG36_04185 [Pirellulaceae bacterium]|jgi:hypothetical protein|nr:hypothetical protein [Pirellulaceae bacterium]MDP7014969.1 hypothetical protein [Pirellulaceae bacterium]